MTRRVDCVECTAAGFPIPADYSCMDPGCDLKALCAVHVMAHRQWGHAVTVLIAADVSDTAPGLDSLLGVTHCPKPEHSGAEGLLTHHCRQCKLLLCRLCSDEHLAKDHTVWPLGRAAADACASIDASLPAVRTGHTRQIALASQLRQMLEMLAESREEAKATLAVNAARLHAEVDAQHAAAVAELEAAYKVKVDGMERALKIVRCCAAELATVGAAGETALVPGCSAVIRVHVRHSVAASLAALKGMQPPDINPTPFVVAGLQLSAGSVGCIETGMCKTERRHGDTTAGGDSERSSDGLADSDNAEPQVGVCSLSQIFCVT